MGHPGVWRLEEVRPATVYVGAGALTRPAMRSIANHWKAQLARRTLRLRSGQAEGVQAYVSRGETGARSFDKVWWMF